MRKIAPLVGLVVVGVVAVPPLVQRVCMRVLLCLFQNLKVFPLVPTAIGCMAGLVPLRHCSRGCVGAPLGSRPSRFPPQSCGGSLALVVFISRSGGGLFSGLTVTSLSPSCTKKLWAAKGSSLHRSLSSPSASGFCFQAVFSSTVWLPFASQADGPSHLLGSPFSLGFSCESLGP